MNYHCQICERVIKAKNGIIAHHGYKRPGHGWQTASCFGARYYPYEKGTEAIPTYIGWLEMMIKNKLEFINKQLTNPPAIINEKVTDAYGRIQREYNHEKPVDFDVNKEPATYSMYSYSASFWRPVKQARTDVEQMRSEVKRMKNRLAAWVKVID